MIMLPTAERFSATGDYGTLAYNGTGLVRLDVGRTDHLAPLLGFVDD
jgi:hypothetical protein